MSYLLLILYLLILCFIIYKAPFYTTSLFQKRWVMGLFISKFAAGVVLWAIYAFFYGSRNSGDIFKYFDDGNIIYSAIRINPIDYLRMVTGIGSNHPELMKYYDTCNFWLKEFDYGLINDNRIIIRFNAVVRLISMGNIHIHTLLMSFLSFTGLWSIYKVFEHKIEKPAIWTILAVFFFPSVCFWTSGLLKEGLLMFGFGTLFYQLNKIIDGDLTLKSGLILILSIGLLALSKFYVLIAALPGISFLILIRYSSTKRLLLKFVGIHLILLFLLWFSKPLFGIDFPYVIAQKQNDFIAFVSSLKQVGSAIELTPIEPTFKSMIYNIPTALYNAFFRPTLFEANGLFMLLAAIENVIIILLLILSVTMFNNTSVNNPLLWFNISFIFMLFSLTGLTTPVLGALVRYKAPALPFLGISFLYFIDKQKIIKITNKLCKWQKLR